MGVEEGEEKQIKGIDNLFNRIIAENFPNLEKQSYPGEGSLQNTKLSEPKTKHSPDTSYSKHSAHRTKKEF
jgi:hypothetical protein